MQEDSEDEMLLKEVGEKALVLDINCVFTGELELGDLSYICGNREIFNNPDLRKGVLEGSQLQLVLHFLLRIRLGLDREVSTRSKTA